MEQGQEARPSERFSGEAAMIDLEREAASLLEQAGESSHGHAQKTLYRHGGVTVAMFALREGAGLPAHAADGVVCVQALRGRLVMRAGDARFELEPGGMVRMAPRVTHDLTAQTAGVALVHIARGE